MGDKIKLMVPNISGTFEETVGENMEIRQQTRGYNIGGMPVVQLEINPPKVNDDVKVVFDELYALWCEQTKFDSHIGKSTNVYYEKIIRLGYSVIPYIIEKLRKEQAHLFLALSRITGENPVKKENMGKVSKMAEDWIQWWEERTHDMG